MPLLRARRGLLRLSTCTVLAALVVFLLATVNSPSHAHGFTSTVFVTATSPAPQQVRLVAELEYDLLLVSVADAADDDALYRAGQPAWESADFDAMREALLAHVPAVRSYLEPRLAVEYADQRCALGEVGQIGVAMDAEQSVPYATAALDYTCPADADAEVLSRGHRITSTVFADAEGYVKGTKTIVTYDLDGRTGSAALESGHGSFSTQQSWGERFWSFYRLGMEHLLHGADHLLFLAALIIGSRRLREVVLAASAFTLAHSLTLVLAALGVVHLQPRVVEPLIAFSIAATAGWFLWRVARQGEHAAKLETASPSHFALDRAGWIRLAVVFGFGLMHGMGFAGALGIDHAWSWSLVWSLVVFNLGIETVQLVLIALIFPILVLGRRRAPQITMWATAAVAAAVAVAGLVWFAQRIFGWSVLPG